MVTNDWKAAWDRWNPTDEEKQRMEQNILAALAAAETPQNTPKRHLFFEFTPVFRTVALCCTVLTVAMVGQRSVMLNRQAFVPPEPLRTMTDSTELTTTTTTAVTTVPRLSCSTTTVSLQQNITTATTSVTTSPVTTTISTITTTAPAPVTSLEEASPEGDDAFYLEDSEEAWDWEDVWEEYEEAEPDSFPVDFYEPEQPSEAFPPEELPPEDVPAETTPPEAPPKFTVTTISSPLPEGYHRGNEFFGSLYDYTYANWDGTRYETLFEEVEYSDDWELLGYSAARGLHNHKYYTIIIYQTDWCDVDEGIVVQYAGDEGYFFFHAVS